MRRQRVYSLLLICIFIFSIFIGGLLFPFHANAQNEDQGRYKTIEVKTVQYIWELVNRDSFVVICEVIIDREGTPTTQNALAVCPDKIYPSTPTPLPIILGSATVTPVPPGAKFNPDQFFMNTFWRFKTKKEYTRLVKIPLPEIVLNVTVPKGPLDQPYVTISAYEPVAEYKIVSIEGKLNLLDFKCEGNQCDIPFSEASRITFRALSSFGDKSKEVQASVQILTRNDGKYPALTSLTPFTVFNDVCAQSWGKSISSYPKWAEFPQLPDGLHTQKSLYFLTSRLIYTGIVNAKECPGAGLFSASSPNGCGMDTARETMIEWQNRYDPMIWSTSRDIGIPPKIIKTLIEKESQFWAGNSLYFMQEFGLGQINQVGADVALRWDNDLYKQICQNVLGNCNTPFASLPSWQQDMIRGSLMTFINSDCPGCVNGLDQTTTNQSIGIIGHVLKANCNQVNYIMKENASSASYEDLWKFTLVSYHSGYQCLYNAIDATFQAGSAASWSNVSANLKCPGAKEYVDDFWSKLVDFDNHLQVAPDVNAPVIKPTFLPTSTPVPTQPPPLSKNSIRVFVYMEVAGKEFPNDIQWVDGIPVQVSTQNGIVFEKKVINGQVTFDMTGLPVGTEVTVSLPGLYRSFTTRLTDTGEILVPFRLRQPVLPQVLP